MARRNKRIKIYPFTGLAGLGILVYLATSTVFKEPDYVHRGFFDEITYLATGATYTAYLKCQRPPSRRGHTLRADSGREAAVFLRRTFPGCTPTRIRRTRRVVIF